MGFHIGKVCAFVKEGDRNWDIFYYIASFTVTVVCVISPIDTHCLKKKSRKIR